MNTVIGTICCSIQCEKYQTCLRTYGTGPCESFYSMGSGSMNSNGSNKIEYCCGPNGNYKMYIDIREINKK